MEREGLVGSRIRERRQVVGLKQADLARQIGISGSYLNLIEHNRRRIGGKLLLNIAQILDVEAAQLSEGAEATMLASLREAEANVSLSGVELDRIEEFAGRFPGWAQLLAATHARVMQLEQTVEGLQDRLANDPALAASVHEVLSTAASIRSTASILAETDALEREWLDRFHANINEDSARLADSSRALAGYLERGQDPDDAQQLPQEEVDNFLARHSYHFADIETRGEAAIDQMIEEAGLTRAARNILRNVLSGYAQDAAILKLSALSEALQALAQPDPLALAERLNAPVGLVMRRMASLPGLGAGYVLCDRSGSLLLRKGLPGFSLPRFGASCPLWPLFEALTQPGTLTHRVVGQIGKREGQFDCYALAEPTGLNRYNAPPLLRSGMLILPNSQPAQATLEVGTSCRVCPKQGCEGRREPSILSDLI